MGQSLPSGSRIGAGSCSSSSTCPLPLQSGQSSPSSTQPRPLQRGQTFIANALQVEHGDRVLPSVMAGRVASTRSFWIKSSPNDARDAIYIHGLDVAPFLGRLGLPWFGQLIINPARTFTLNHFQKFVVKWLALLVLLSAGICTLSFVERPDLTKTFRLVSYAKR